MIKFLVRLAVFGLLANATWRVGSAYLNHYRFEDSVQETAQFRGGKSDDEVRERVYEIATDYDVPLGADAVTVRTDSNHTIVDGSYARPVSLLPGYIYSWPFTFHIETLIEIPLKPSNIVRPK